MPPPAGMPTGGEQQLSRRPAVPVWDPPVTPGPKRSWKERLGLGPKRDPAKQPPIAHRAEAPPASSVPTVRRSAPAAPSGNGSGSGPGATAGITGERRPVAPPAPDPNRHSPLSHRPLWQPWHAPPTEVRYPRVARHRQSHPKAVSRLLRWLRTAVQRAQHLLRTSPRDNRPAWARCRHPTPHLMAPRQGCCRQ